MLTVSNIHKRYKMGENLIYALRGVSLTIESGDFVAIMGPSGSGKSTLMHVLGLLDVPDEGSYQINGKEVSKLSEDELAILRRDFIGFIFQQFNLLPRMSALENVAMPLMYSTNNIDLVRAKELLDLVKLGNRADHRSNEMSGGQQQRVAIARALVNHPFLIFADEPTGNLDSVSQEEIVKILQELNESGITIVIVTHEEEVGMKAKRIIRMRDGAVIGDERYSPIRNFRDPQELQSFQTSPTAKQSETNVPNSKKAVSKSHRMIPLSHLFMHFKQGIKTLAANKVRTALSILGILIGVGAVVSMLALGRGAQAALKEQLSSLGSNLLIMRAGALRGMGGAMVEAGATARLTLEDAQVIKDQVEGINEVAPTATGRGQITFLNKNRNSSVVGVAQTYAKIHNDRPIAGRFFTDEENKKRSRVAVVGATIIREVMGGKNPIGEMIKINKVTFQVIGVLPEKGASTFQDQDDRILIPLNTAMRRLFGKEYVDSIDIEVKGPELTEGVQSKVLEIMLARHKVPAAKREDAFVIRNMAEIQAAVSASTDIMTMLLSVIAAISLLVGGIGIMNIMLVSVTERTREIGLRKAVGAKRSDILAQFLTEAVVISLVGGFFGLALAWVSTVLLSVLAGWATSITVSSVALAIIFSSSIGVIFGLYPARKASLLPPIDALRYE
jgi:macrolide transport system ATP-binding/permease protein